jgi:hypothetical protein
MALEQAGNISEAVLFFSDKGVSKEMLFPEFESVLDNVVGLNDCKNQEVRAAFIKITAQHTITSAVFFLIKFNVQGMADNDWNMPLRHLADTNAHFGPDIGAGPVRLVCRSQCSSQWLEDQLWDPEITDECNHFALMRDAIKRNRLGLLYVAPETDIPDVASDKKTDKSAATVQAAVDAIGKSKSGSDIDPKAVEKLKEVLEKDLQKKLEEVEHKQKLFLATLESKHKREFDKLHGDHQADIQTYKNQLIKFKGLLEEERTKTQKTITTLQDQLQQTQQQRIQLEESLNMSAKDKEKLEALKQQYELEMQAKLEAERADMLEQLEMREVELLYRHQQESQFKLMLEQLRQDKITLLGEGADRYLERLNKSGIVFVAYQPGSGHLTIPLSQMGRYMDDPLAYVAEKNGLTIEHYKAWLAHYNNSLCVAKLGDGTRCTAALKKVLTPKEFVDGEHNYCIVHRAQINKTPV